MKFGGNRLLLDGFVEVKSKEEADEVPLAKVLYDEFKFVKEVFVSENFVAVTKDDSVQWHEVMTVVRNVIAEFYKMVQNHQQRTSETRKSCRKKKIINREYTDVEQKISDILTEYVSPAVENDGGKSHF